MSATFKLAKKKHTQHDLRRLMNEQKPKQAAVVKKIDSPLAKYPFEIINIILIKSFFKKNIFYLNIHFFFIIHV